MNIYNKLRVIDKSNMTATFENEKLGDCILEFILNDGSMTSYIEPYIIHYKENGKEVMIELLDTDITLIGLYRVLSILTLHHVRL